MGGKKGPGGVGQDGLTNIPRVKTERGFAVKEGLSLIQYLPCAKCCYSGILTASKT